MSQYKKIFAIITVLVLVLIIVSISLFYVFQLQKFSIVNMGYEELQSHVNKSQSEGKDYISKYPFDNQKKEGAILSQTFANQIWIFGTIKEFPIDISTGKGTLYLSILDNVLNFDVTTNTLYLDNNIVDISQSTALGARDLEIGDKVQITFSSSNLNSQVNPVAIYVKKL